MTPKEKLLKIVLDAKGDDLERCEQAFRGFDVKEMSRQYGQGGRTKIEILNAYRKGRQEWEAAYKLLQKVLK